jgi:zinc transport system substrate-binding protein
VALAAAACGASPEGEPGELRVVAAFYPLAEAARAIGGDAVSVENLTPPGVEPHDLELAPDDLETLVTADVVLYLGGGFQPAVEDGVEQAEGVAVDVLESVGSLLPPPAGEDGGSLAHDPHVWLDPRRFAEIVDGIDGAMAGAAPGSAAAFRSNADAYTSSLAALDREMAEGLATCRSRTMVVNHAAFGYLADRYGLEQVAISGLAPEAEPDPSCGSTGSRRSSPRSSPRPRSRRRSPTRPGSRPPSWIRSRASRARRRRPARITVR